MTGKLGDTGVGEMFATKPGRASGLAGTLAPRPQLAPPLVPSTAPDTARPNPTSRRPPTEGSGRTRQPESKPAPPTSSAVTVVYVTQEDVDWIAGQRRATGLTSAQVVLAAVEQHVDQLGDQLTPEPAPVRKTGLFATLSRPQAGTRPRHVQFGLRGIATEDRRVLDRLVAETETGSLSALVRGALLLARTAPSAP